MICVEDIIIALGVFSALRDIMICGGILSVH